MLYMKNICLYPILFLILIASCVTFSACSSEDEESVPSTTIELYGTTVPYTPMDEQGFPEWLRQLKNDKKMFGLHSVCMGTLNDEVVYFLDVRTDSYMGRLYDKDGNFISLGLNDFMSKVCNLRCIYYSNL